MKHLILSIFLTITFATTFAQYFNEVKIDGSSADYITRIKAKGYILKEYFKNGNGAILKKDLNELYVFWTPKTKIVYKATVYLPKKESWYGLKAEYEKYSDILSNKYGQPKSDDVYAYFSKPYYEGDGYELSALTLGKVTYFTFWDLSATENTQIGLSISKYQQIEISYENYKNGLIKAEEQKEIDNKVF
jgi:hypothetical protein